MARKTLPSAVIKNLPAETQAALLEFLDTSQAVASGAEMVMRKPTLAQGVEWLQDKHGVKTSDTSLSDWRAWYVMLHDIGTWNSEVDELTAKLRERGDMPDDLIERIGETVFLSRAAKEKDAKTFAAVCAVIQREREGRFEAWKGKEQIDIKRQSLKQSERNLSMMERKLAALEKKAAALEAANMRAKAALQGGGVMDDAARAALVEEMDAVVLNKRKKAA